MSSTETGADASAHYLYSSYREVLLEHLLAGEIMRHLWCRGLVRIEVLKPQVDDGGYDLVLEANGVVRHVQLKASHHGSATQRVPVNVALARKPSGCVVWVRFDEKTLELGPFLWFGGVPGEKLPSLKELQVGKHAKANALGVKTERPNIRVLPRSRFTELPDVEALVLALFGELQAEK